jgi:hypothetical protein
MTYAQQQNKETLDDVSQRVKILEGQKENLDVRFKNKSDALDLKFEKLEKKLKDDYNHLEILLKIFGPITVLGFVIAIISVYIKLKKWVLKVAYKKINEKFDSLLDEKKNSIIEIIENHDIETQLRKTKKILVLTPDGADDSLLKKYFEIMGFKLRDFRTLEDPPNLREYHLVLLNNEDNKFKKNVIYDMVTNTKNVMFFYFGAPSEDSGRIRNEKNVAFANYGAQLYGNLINALRYQQLLQ